ncbi:MAG TPA: hypothetical protein DCY93_04275 [Firmicutes bacterium]|nr:hypothetical protein [Bacillota bacterium]
MGTLLLIIVAVSLAIGAVILVLCGITVVKKNHAKIIEIAGNFHEVLKEGVYFRHPFLYHVVGNYSLLIKKTIIKLNNFSLEIEHKIVDPKMYHYNGHCFIEWISEKLNDVLDKDALSSSILSEAEKCGVEIESMNIYAK